MKKRIKLGISMVLLCFLGLVLNVPPAVSAIRFQVEKFKKPGDLLGANNVISKSSFRTVSHVPASYFESGLSHPLEKGFQSIFEAGDQWGFVNRKKWGDSSSQYGDSSELVIGLTEKVLYDHSEFMNLVTLCGGRLVNSVQIDGRICAAVVEIPDQAKPTFIAEVEDAGFSRYIEPNILYEADIVPNDPDFPYQWGLTSIEAELAWDTQVGNSSILVAVVDTGVDWNHPDLSANYTPLGYDWVNNDTDPMDDHGHGTHCAGIVAAVLNNSIGIAGVAQVRVMAEKALDSQGLGHEDDLAQAIIHAVDSGAHIISNSWGAYFDSTLIHDAVRYACENNVLVIASAGNDGTLTKEYPAGYDEVVAVSATDMYDQPAAFTNFGEWIEVSAPGVDVYSTVWDNSYESHSGTSMSTPHVAGVAALIWSQFPAMTPDQVRAQLHYTADDLGYHGFDIYYGYGRINARKAVERKPPDHDLLISRLEMPPYVKPGNTVVVNTTVFNFGKSGESSLTLQLYVNDSSIDSAVIPFLADVNSTTVSFSWTPLAEGIYNVTSSVQSVLGETVTENNAISVSVTVRSAQIFSVPRDYPTIQAALSNSISGIGDTVEVAAGTYYEHVSIHNSVSIVGEDRNTTIIDGNGVGTVVSIALCIPASARAYAVGGVNLSGFTIRNGEFKGVYVQEASCNIYSNILSHNGYGIYLQECISCTLRDNIMFGNTFNLDVRGNILPEFVHEIDSSNTVDGKPVYYLVNTSFEEVPSDAGYVAAVNSSNILVQNLDLENNGQGVLFAYTSNSTVANLNISRNYLGIVFFESTDNTIKANKIRENDFGVVLESNSDRNIVAGNRVSTNVFGIWFYASSSNMVIANNVSENSLLGIILESTSHNNTIFHNNFIDNRYQALAVFMHSNSWDGGYASGGNFWSSYKGTDLNYGPHQNLTGYDGIGDTPFIIDADDQDRYPLMGQWPSLTGDINRDGLVDMIDIFAVILAFGSKQENSRWNPHVDINKDDKIDLQDIYLIITNFAKQDS